MGDKTSRLENQILHFSKIEKWSRVETHWSEIIQNPPSDPKFYATFSQRMVQAEKTAELRSWILLLVEHLQSSEQFKTLIQVARGVLHAVPGFDELRQPLLTALRAQYAQHPQLEAYISASGLADEQLLGKPLNRFLQYVQSSEGEVFQHAVWGVGKVIEINPKEQKVIIEFPTQGKKIFSFEGVRDFLKKLPRNHLFAQRLLKPEGLVKQADADPVEFLKYCLKSLGGVTTQADLKEHLLQGVFDARKWNAWWGKNRQKFRLDPYIGFSGSPGNAHLQLRTQPRSFAEEVLMAFQQTESFISQYNLVLEVIKHREAEPISEEAVQKILDQLGERLKEVPEDKTAKRIEYLLLMKSMQNMLPQSATDGEVEAFALLDSSDNPVDVISNMVVFDYQMKMAEHLKAASLEKWPELAEEIFLYGPTRLAQWVLRDLSDSGNTGAAGHIAEQLLHRPHLNPDLFIWMVKSQRNEKWSSLHIDMPSDMLYSVILEMIDDCQKRIVREDPDASGLKGLQARLANLFMDSNHAVLIDVFEPLEPEQASERYRALMAHPNLTASFKVTLDHALRAIRDDLDQAKAGDAKEEEHFVTAESYEARQKEYIKIKNDDIPANSKAIGDAARMGDLSENAEYHSAKERQKMLFRRLESLESQLHRAKVVGPDSIATDVIGFGTAFEIKNLDSGEVEHYQLRGIWDADPEKRVLSYLTPFGKQFLNRKVGDSLIVEHPGGGTTRYQVLSICNALKATE